MLVSVFSKTSLRVILMRIKVKTLYYQSRQLSLDNPNRKFWLVLEDNLILRGMQNHASMSHLIRSLSL